MNKCDIALRCETENWPISLYISKKVLMTTYFIDNK